MLSLNIRSFSQGNCAILNVSSEFFQELNDIKTFHLVDEIIIVSNVLRRDIHSKALEI